MNHFSESLFRAEDFIDRIKRLEKPVVLYGVGDGAEKIIEYLDGFGISPAGVFVSDAFVRDGRTFRGMPVLTLDVAEERFGDFTAVSAFGAEGREVDVIRGLAPRHGVVVPNLPVYDSGRLGKRYIKENIEKIDYVRSRFEDEMSCRIFDSVLEFCITDRKSTRLNSSH